MASTNTITQTTPTIERVPEIFVNSILEGTTVDSGLFTIIPRVRNKFAMKTGAISGMIQAYACKPTPTGGTTITDEEFEIQMKSIFHDICYDTFENTEWKDAIANVKNEGLPSEFVEFLSATIAAEASGDVEDEMWNGNAGLPDDPTGANVIDGFGELIRTNLTAASLTGQIVELTADPTDPAQVQGILRAIKSAATKAMLKDLKDLRFFVDPLVEAALYSSYTTTTATNIPQTDSLMFERIKIQVINNLNTERIILGNPKNMGIALATDGDLVELDIIDQYALGQGNFARAVGNFGYGVGIATTDFVLAENLVP